jgi:hypothetical protein
MGITMGANVLIAQFYGAKDEGRIRAVVETTYLTLAVVSVALTTLGMVIARPVLTLLRVPEEIRADAVVYLRILFGGLVFIFGFNGVGAILRGLGDSVTPLYMLILSTILNIIMDWVFVRFFHWGVAGAAWATIIAQGVSCGCSLLYLNKTHPLLRTNFLRLKLNRPGLGGKFPGKAIRRGPHIGGPVFAAPPPFGIGVGQDPHQREIPVLQAKPDQGFQGGYGNGRAAREEDPHPSPAVRVTSPGFAASRIWQGSYSVLAPEAGL